MRGIRYIQFAPFCFLENDLNLVFHIKKFILVIVLVVLYYTYFTY